MYSSQTKTKQNKNLSAKNPKKGIGIKMENVIMSHSHLECALYSSDLPLS